MCTRDEGRRLTEVYEKYKGEGRKVDIEDAPPWRSSRTRTAPSSS